jgi:Flp pilus assembly protein TadG
MKGKWFLRLRSDSDSGSITAETAISISFLLICGFALVQVLTFAMQFQRLQTLAQESSRVAASLENPMILEKQILLFLKNTIQILMLSLIGKNLK